MFIKIGLILAIFLIDLMPCAANVSDAQAAMVMTKQGIETADKVLDLYNKLFDRVITRKEIENITKEFDCYREDYSNESKELVENIKILLTNGIYAYNSATNSIYEWCGLTKRLLTTYLELFNEVDIKNAENQKTILLNVLNIGVTKMNAAQIQLVNSSVTFNNASGQLSSLQTRLKNDYDKSSDYYKNQVKKIWERAYAGAVSGVILGPIGLAIAYAIATGIVEGQKVPKLNEEMASIQRFYDNVKDTIGKANIEIDTTKEQLMKEIKQIGELKVQTEETNIYLPLDSMRDIIKTSVNRLISHCQEYQRKHG